MSRWFRLYTDVLDDPKVQKLPPVLFKTWVNLLCLAGRHNGSLPDIEDIAFSLRLDDETCRAHICDLVERGLIDAGEGLRPHNWDGRQFKSDQDETAAERQRRKRERDKAETSPRDTAEHVTRDTPVTSRPPDTDTDTDTETDEGRVGSARDLEADLRNAAGWQNEPAPMLAVTGEVQALIDAGADLELDVLPVVKALAPRCSGRTTWRYFLNAIARQRDQRIAAASIVSPPSSLTGNSHGQHRQNPSRSDIFAAINARIDAAERIGFAQGDGHDAIPPERAA